MKLEAETLKDHPEILIDEIKLRLSDSYLPEEKDQVRSSEEAFIDKFRNIQKPEIKSLLETTKYLVQNRDKLNEKQVRLRNIMRSLYLRIGGNFTTAGIIHDKRDIFFLNSTEITAIIEKGKYTNEEIQERIEKRKAEYAENLEKPFNECIHFFGAIQPENMIVFTSD